MYHLQQLIVQQPRRVAGVSISRVSGEETITAWHDLQAAVRSVAEGYQTQLPSKRSLLGQELQP